MVTRTTNSPSFLPTTLSDAALRSLRCRSDRLGVFLLLGGAVFLFALVPALWPLIGVLAGLALASCTATAYQYLWLRTTAPDIGGTTAGAWGDAAAAVLTRAGIRTGGIRVVVVQSARPNAFAVWSPFGRLIAVTSSMVELLEDDPTAQHFVLGHELGHLLFSHQPWYSLVHVLFSLPGPLGFCGRLLGLGWFRAAERSADRLGLLLCESPRAAARTLLALGSGRAADTTLAAELHALPARRTGVLGYLSDAFATHPSPRPRLEALFTFAASNEFARIAGRKASEAACWQLAALRLHPDRTGCPW